MNNITDEYIIELCRKYSKSTCDVTLEEFASGDYGYLEVIEPVYKELGGIMTKDDWFADEQLENRIYDIIASFDSCENY